MITFRRLATNYTLLVAGEVFGKLFTFFAFMYLARTLGPVYYGHLEFTIAVLVFFTLFVDLGTSPWGAREIAREPERIQEALSGIFYLRLLMSIAGVLIVFAFSRTVEDANLKRLLVLYSFSLFGIPFLLQWVFQGLQRMKFVAWANVIRQCVFCLLIFSIVKTRENLIRIGWIECVSILGIAIFCLIVYQKEIGKFHPVWNTDAIKNALKQSYPIGLSELSWAFVWYSAIVILGFLIGGNAVGYFGASQRPVMSIHTFIWLHFYNLLPSISQSMQRGTDHLRGLLDRTLMMAAWGAFLLGSCGTILAQPLILLIYGPQYASAVSIFQILIWVLAALLISGHFSYALIGWNLQRFHMVSFLAATIVSLTFSFLLIPRFQAIGAAIAVLGGILTKGLLAWYFVNKKIGTVPVLRHLWRPFIPALVSMILFQMLPHWNPFVMATVVIALFGVFLWISQPDLFARVRLAWKE
jgi:O-antigen/teichoic acid export membrane protein